MKNGDVPIKNGDVPIKNGDFPLHLSPLGWPELCASAAAP